MGEKIIISTENEDPKTIPFEGDKLTVGRSDNNDVVLNGAGVSRTHLLIERRESKIFLQDLGSTNGTFLNHEQLAPNTLVEWPYAFPLQVGIYWLKLEPSSELEATAKIAIPVDPPTEPIPIPDTSPPQTDRLKEASQPPASATDSPTPQTDSPEVVSQSPPPVASSRPTQVASTSRDATPRSQVSPAEADQRATHVSQPQQPAQASTSRDYGEPQVNAQTFGAQPAQRNDLSDFADSVLKVSEIKRDLNFLNYILAAPIERTMTIVKTGESPVGDPYHFMAFGIAISTLVAGSSGIFAEEFSFIEGILNNLLFILFTLIGAACSFYVIRAIIKSQHQFRNFLRLTAVVLGLQSTVQGAAILSLIFFGEGIFLILYFVGLGYLLVVTYRLYKRFWELPYWKIIVYNLIAAVPAVVVFMVISAIFGGLLFSSVGSRY